MYFYGFLLRKILEILQFFQYAKPYEGMENVGIASFYRICVLASTITMRLLFLVVLCGDESLISVFRFLCKAIVPVYWSAYLPLLLSKKILSCSLRFIKFLILNALRLILFLTFLFYLVVLYLLSVLLTSNMSCIGSVFDDNVSFIVNDDFNDFRPFLNDDFNDFRSFLIFSNNSVVNVDAHFKVGDYLNRKFYGHNFQSKPESNSNNFKPEILFLVFSLMFYHSFLKNNRELRVKIFTFLTLTSVLNVMKYFKHSEVDDGIKICSQLHFFMYESITTCDNVETSCLHSDLVFFSISKIQYKNSNSYFNLLLLLSGDISLNPGPPHNNQLQPQNEWSVFNSRGLHFIHLNINSLLPKIDELRNIAKLSNAAVIGIGESKLNDSVLSSEIHIDNYNTLRCDWNRHGGGVVCYIRNNLSYDVKFFFSA